MKSQKIVTVVATIVAFLTIGVMLRPIAVNAADPITLTANDGTVYISYDGIVWERYTPTVNGYVCTSSVDKTFTWRGEGLPPYYGGNPVWITSYSANWMPMAPDLQFWCDYFAFSYGYPCKSSSVEYTVYSTDSWSKTTVNYY